ncbi:Calx-beta domain-containing protein [Herpetosiphon llansteffanensis]
MRILRRILLILAVFIFILGIIPISAQEFEHKDQEQFHGLTKTAIMDKEDISKFKITDSCIYLNINQWVNMLYNALTQIGWFHWSCNASYIMPIANRYTIVDEVPAEDLIHYDLPYTLAGDQQSFKNVVPTTNAVSYTFTITNVGQLADSYTISATSSSSWPLTYSPQAISLVPGESTQITVFLSIPPNSLVNQTDTVDVVTQSTHDFYTMSESHGYTTIVIPTISFFQKNHFIPEQNTTIFVKVVLDNYVENIVTLDFHTTDGTAVGNLPCTTPTCGDMEGDFTHTNGTLTFQPGEMEKNIVIQINADVKNDPNEVFSLTLSSPQNAVLHDSARIDIVIQ